MTTMKNSFWMFGVAALSLVACKTPLNITQVQTQKNISISAEMPSDETMDKMIAPYKASLQSQMNAKLSYTATELTKVGDNSSLGNLLADYTLKGAKQWATGNAIPKVDAAVINIGGIRASIGKGDILLRHLYEVMPFENELVLVKMSGTQLQGLLDYYQEHEKNNPVSGLEIETDRGTLTKALINGVAIQPNEVYYIATSDFLALGGDGMKFFGNGEMISTGIKLRDLYIQIFKEVPSVVPPTDIRLNFKNKKQ